MGTDLQEGRDIHTLSSRSAHKEDTVANSTSRKARHLPHGKSSEQVRFHETTTKRMLQTSGRILGLMTLWMMDH